MWGRVHVLQNMSIKSLSDILYTVTDTAHGLPARSRTAALHKGRV